MSEVCTYRCAGMALTEVRHLLLQFLWDISVTFSVFITGAGPTKKGTTDVDILSVLPFWPKRREKEQFFKHHIVQL